MTRSLPLCIPRWPQAQVWLAVAWVSAASLVLPVTARAADPAAPAARTAAPAAPAASVAPVARPAAPVAPPEVASPAARAALEELLALPPSGDTVGAADAGRTTTAVRAGETLDVIIRRTMGDMPFKDSLMRAAFVNANPRAYPNGNIQRLPTGTVLNVPSMADLRLLLARSLGPERVAALRAAQAAPSATQAAAAASAARAASAAAAFPPPPPRPDHRGWVRFP
jgi:pilus assembly protein FimV